MAEPFPPHQFQCEEAEEGLFFADDAGFGQRKRLQHLQNSRLDNVGEKQEQSRHLALLMKRFQLLQIQVMRGLSDQRVFLGAASLGGGPAGEFFESGILQNPFDGAGAQFDVLFPQELDNVVDRPAFLSPFANGLSDIGSDPSIFRTGTSLGEELQFSGTEIMRESIE